MNALGVLHAQPALSVMKLMVARQEQQAEGKSVGMPETAPPETPKTTEASEEFYFGTGMTVTKLMFFMMKHIVGYLNGKLETGRDGDSQGEIEGENWRKQALLEDTPINSDKDFTLPEPGENGVSFGDVARMIKSRFNMDFLGRDRDLVRLLEKLIGFRFNGINPADIIEAFADPESNKAQKVREALEEGLAGEEGSKVSQRLDRAAEGPKTTAQVLADKGSAADVVDDETLQEDLEELKAARINEQLGEIRDMHDAVAEAVKERGPADGRADPEDARKAIDAAMQMIQKLSDAAPKDETPAADDEDLSEVVSEDAESKADLSAKEMVEALAAKEIEFEEKAAAYAAVAEAYREDAEDWRGRRDDDEKVRFRI